MESVEVYAGNPTGVMIEEERMEVDVRMYNEDVKLIPEYESAHAAGFDLKANLKQSIVIPPAGRGKRWFDFLKKNKVAEKNWVLIPTGTRTEIPVGYEIQIRPRSGLALKNGISIVNSPGTIDSKMV